MGGCGDTTYRWVRTIPVKDANNLVPNMSPPADLTCRMLAQKLGKAKGAAEVKNASSYLQ